MEELHSDHFLGCFKILLGDKTVARADEELSLGSEPHGFQTWAPGWLWAMEQISSPSNLHCLICKMGF